MNERATMNERTEDRVDWDGYWGRCPTCHEPADIVDVGPAHYGVCRHHRVYWRVGYNLFSAWREQTDAQREWNAVMLASYKKAQPYYMPPEAAAAVNAAATAKAEAPVDYGDDLPF